MGSEQLKPKEALAKAIHEPSGEILDGYMDEIFIILERLGYVVAPKEITTDMILAGARLNGSMTLAWKILINARPK